MERSQRQEKSVSCCTDGVIFVKYGFLFMILALEDLKMWEQEKSCILTLEVIGKRCCIELYKRKRQG